VRNSEEQGRPLSEQMHRERMRPGCNANVLDADRRRRRLVKRASRHTPCGRGRRTAGPESRAHERDADVQRFNDAPRGLEGHREGRVARRALPDAPTASSLGAGYRGRRPPGSRQTRATASREVVRLSRAVQGRRLRASVSSKVLADQHARRPAGTEPRGACAGSYCPAG
jgi:hypothetical protein